MRQSSPIHVVYILDWTKLYLFPGLFFFLPESLSDYLLELFKNRTCEKHHEKITGNPLFNKCFCHTLCLVDYYFGEGQKKPFEKSGKRAVNSDDTRVTGIGN